MKATRRKAALLTVLLVLLAVGFRAWQLRLGSRVLENSALTPISATAPRKPRSGSLDEATPVTRVGELVSNTAADGEKAELERHRQIDREHLTKLHAGIFAFKAKYGHFPEYLTQLVPEFVTAEVLVSPNKKAAARDFADIDHADPGMKQPSYGYEFSNLEYRDGRTFAEIKEVQRAEWGDVVPLLRCFAYGDRVMNMAYGGDIYETALNWEWDSATMDLVDKYGWGPGLEAGEKVAVRVTKPDGTPVAGARVWADGRNYTFDLPNRPFSTDANGYTHIPVGVDIDRTALQLRAEAPGLAAPTTRFAAGQLPESPLLILDTAQSVGGLALDATGQPMANARVYLKASESDGSGGVGRSNEVAQVVTDASGHWQTEVHPKDAASLSALIGVPGGPPVKYSLGQPLDPAAATAGRAVVSLPSPR